MSTLKHFTVILLVFVLAACAAKSPLEQNQQKWIDQNINHYRYQVSIICFCAFRDQMPLNVEVLDGKVVTLTDKDGNPVDVQFDESFQKAATVENLFALTGAALKDAAEVTVEYDPAYGFPTSISIDNIKDAVDDEITYQVENFEVLK